MKLITISVYVRMLALLPSVIRQSKKIHAICLTHRMPPLGCNINDLLAQDQHNRGLNKIHVLQMVRNKPDKDSMTCYFLHFQMTSSQCLPNKTHSPKYALLHLTFCIIYPYKKSTKWGGIKKNKNQQLLNPLGTVHLSKIIFHAY